MRANDRLSIIIFRNCDFDAPAHEILCTACVGCYGHNFFLSLSNFKQANNENATLSLEMCCLDV